MNFRNSDHRLALFESRIEKERMRLLSHPIYHELNSLDSIRTFMKFHVFAVWDFMSLLKTLQARLTSIAIPWTPSPHPILSRFINEIVLAEESDEVGPGEYLSHFELYRLAMNEAHADTSPIQSFLNQVMGCRDIHQVLSSKNLNEGVGDFMRVTFQLISGNTHEVASSFLFGREDVIPQMFQLFLRKMDLLDLPQFTRMKQYLERHIEIDGEHHGPLARKMLIELCGDDEKKWDQAEVAALKSIQARIRLWDYIYHQLKPVAVSHRTQGVAQN